MVRRIFNKTKGLLTQNEGLGYLQVYNLMKTAGIVILSIVFAKFVKDPILINNWETILLLGTGFTFFYVSGLGYTLVSFIKRYHQTMWPEVFRNTFILLLIFSFVSCTGIIITGLYFKSISFPLPELVLFCIYITGTVCSTVLEYIYFLKGSFRKLIGWGILNFILFITLPAIPLIYGYGFIYSLYALAIFGFLKFVFTLSLIKGPFNFKNLEYIKPLMVFNWPIILSLLFGTGYVYVANFILKAKVSDIDFNLFRYGSREFPLFIVLANSFSIVLGGITTERFGQHGYWEDVKKSHLRLMHQVFPMACLLILTSRYIFEYLFSEQFILSYPIFNILLLTLIARVLFPQSLLMGKGKNKFALYSAVVEFIIGIALVFILTPLYGIHGAAYGIALAYYTDKILLIVFCYRQKIPFHQSMNLKWLALYTLLLVVCFAISIL